jgi:hypothetical protein
MRQRIAAVAALTLLLAAPLAAAPRPVALQPDVHFLDAKGQVVRGQRCATPPLTAAQRREVGEVLRLLDRVKARPGGGSVVIPVAFHVIYSERKGVQEGNVPDARIQAQMDVLDDAFAPHGYSFTLASVDRTLDNRWFGGCWGRGAESAMKEALAVDVPNTLNVYTCSPKNGILGYAYLPSSMPEDNPLHGVVLLHSSLPGGTAAPYNLGDTATHEVGHYLGLDHTFEGGCQEPGDFVADTPAEASPASGCPVGRDTCAAPGLDPIENFMDYSDDACIIRFTPGQKAFMDDMVAAYKPSLLD